MAVEIVPGGYVEHGETPQHALVREYLEETGVTIEPENIIGIRFNMHDWYIAFRAKYISGEPISDNDENSEVLWTDVNEALIREDVPELTKKLIQSALSNDTGLHVTDYESTSHPPFCYIVYDNAQRRNSQKGEIACSKREYEKEPL